MNLKTILKKAEQWKYPLLILVIGLLLMLMPTGKEKEETKSENVDLKEILSSAEGIGTAEVLISEHGVVIVCEGAYDASVKLDIIRAVGSYTGFGADKITILRLVDH